MTKTKTDLVGSEAAGVVTWENLAADATFPSPLTRRDISGKVGVAFLFRQKSGGSKPTTNPKLEIFCAPSDYLSLQDSEAYETVEIVPVNSEEKQITIPLRFAEDVPFISWKITNGATNASDFYLAILETNL